MVSAPLLGPLGQNPTALVKKTSPAAPLGQSVGAVCAVAQLSLQNLAPPCSV